MSRNKKMAIRLLSIAILWSTFHIDLGAQDEPGQECAFTLEKAEKLFEEGFIGKIPDMLSPCIEKGFTREEKLSAYKLIILSYLFDDKKAEAELTMKNFLKRYPEYEILPTDPVEFVYIYESYNVKPLFKLGVIGGINYTGVNLVEIQGLHDYSQASVDYSTSGSGLSGGISLATRVTGDIDANIEILMDQNRYIARDNIYPSYHVNFDEWNLKLLIPVTAVYTFHQVQLVDPYIRLGIAPGILLSASANARGVYTDNSHIDVTGPDFETTNLNRNKFGLWGVLGTGVKYGIPRGNIFLDVRYNLGLLNYTMEAPTNLDNELATKFKYQDNVFKLSNIALAVGYEFIFYKPVKK